MRANIARTNFRLVVKGEHAVAAARGRQAVGASPPFKSNMGEVADAGGMRVVGAAEDDIDQVRGCGILPDLGIDAGEIDPLVEPAADPIVAGIGDKVRKAADVFIVPGLADCPRSPPSRASRRGRC